MAICSVMDGCHTAGRLPLEVSPGCAGCLADRHPTCISSTDLDSEPCAEIPTSTKLVTSPDDDGREPQLAQCHMYGGMAPVHNGHGPHRDLLTTPVSSPPRHRHRVRDQRLDIQLQCLWRQATGCYQVHVGALGQEFLRGQCLN